MPATNREEWLPDEQLTPCSNCDKPYTNPVLRIIDVNIALVDIATNRQRLGLAQMFNGNEQLSRIMGSYPDGVVRVNTDPDGKTKLLLCNDCYCQDLCIPLLVEKVHRRKAERDAAGEEQTQQRTA